MGGVVADRRLLLSKQGRLVEEGDPAGSFLLAAKGQTIQASVVELHDLRVVGGRVVQGKPEVDDAGGAAGAARKRRRGGENKARKVPVSNKAARGSAKREG